jgi:hypothetical protein
MARLHAVTGSQWRRTVGIAGRSASWHGVQSSSLLPHARTAADPHRCFSELAPDRQKHPLDGSTGACSQRVVQLAIGQQPGIGGDRRAAKLKHGVSCRQRNGNCSRRYISGTDGSFRPRSSRQRPKLPRAVCADRSGASNAAWLYRGFWCSRTPPRTAMN